MVHALPGVLGFSIADLGEPGRVPFVNHGHNALPPAWLWYGRGMSFMGTSPTVACPVPYQTFYCEAWCAQSISHVGGLSLLLLLPLPLNSPADPVRTYAYTRAT